MEDRRAGEVSVTVVVLSRDRHPEVVDVLAESFHDYPVMRFVLGSGGTAYEEALPMLVRLFVMARVLRGEPLLGVEGTSGLDAAAIVSRPGEPSPQAFRALADDVWAALGGQARARYRAFTEACAPFHVDAPHLHLNMVGVRRHAQGTGLGRALIEHVQEMSRGDARSVGVTLTTEDPANVPLYEHLGYGIVGQATVSSELTTWGFFRPN